MLLNKRVEVLAFVGALAIVAIVLSTPGTSRGYLPPAVGHAVPWPQPAHLHVAYHNPHDTTLGNASDSHGPSEVPSADAPRADARNSSPSLHQTFDANDTLLYPFTNVFPFSFLETSLLRFEGGGSCIRLDPMMQHDDREGAAEWNRRTSLFALCTRNPMAMGLNCADVLAVGTAAAVEDCSRQAKELLTCTAAFDSWLPCVNTLRPHGNLVESCVSVHGLPAVERWVPTTCRASRLWGALTQHVCRTLNCAGRGAGGGVGAYREDSLLLGDVVSRSQRRPRHPPPYVAPKDRHPSPYGPPVTCRTGASDTVTIHGLNFAYPLELMAEDSDRWKLFGFSAASPKKGAEKRDYDINDEYRLVFDMRRSMYAFTTRRWGWDCLRHWELLGSGTVPYFIDLPVAADTILSSLPKALLLAALGRPEVRHLGAVWTAGSQQQSPPHNYFTYTGPHQQDGGAHVAINASVPPSVDFTQLPNMTSYHHDRKILLDYTRQYLSTASAAASVLQRMGHPEAITILFLHGVTHMDFQKLSLHHGLVNGLGLKVTSFPRNEAHFQRSNVSTMEELEAARERYLRVHGNGYSYGMRVFDGENGVEAGNLEKRIASREFDLVIFTFTSFSPTLSRQLPFFREVTAVYPRDRIGFVNGDDVFGPPGDQLPPRLALYAARFGHVFLRELYPSKPLCPQQSRDDAELLVFAGSSHVALHNTSADGDGGLKRCDLPTVVAAQSMQESSAHSASPQDAVIVNGESGVGSIMKLLHSLRMVARMRAPMVILAVTANTTLKDLREVLSRGEMDVYRPLAVFFAVDIATNEALYMGSPQRRFLGAVERVLVAPLSFGLQRFVVVENSRPVVFRQDLLRSVGGAELWFARHAIVSNVHHVGSARFCFGEPHVAAHRVDTQHHIGHEILGGYRGALLRLIADVEGVYPHMHSIWCGYDAALNAVVHNGTYDRTAQIFSVEKGPVVYDVMEECDALKSLVVQRTQVANVADVMLPCVASANARAAVVVGDACRLLGSV